MRIDRMRKVNEFVEELKKQTKGQIRQKMKDEPDAYKQLLEDLMVQGLIKMMEAQLFVRCRECDVSLLEEITTTAVEKYRELIVKG